MNGPARARPGRRSSPSPAACAASRWRSAGPRRAAAAGVIRWQDGTPAGPHVMRMNRCSMLPRVFRACGSSRGRHAVHVVLELVFQRTEQPALLLLSHDSLTPARFRVEYDTENKLPHRWPCQASSDAAGFVRNRNHRLDRTGPLRGRQGGEPIQGVEELPQPPMSRRLKDSRNRVVGKAVLVPSSVGPPSR